MNQALIRSWLLVCASMATNPVHADLLRYRYDAANSGINDQEKVLTPANVNPATFGRLATLPVDGQIFAQPLVKSAVRITVGPEAGMHDAVFVATEHDSVYAFDTHNGRQLWQRSFLDIPRLITSVPAPEIQGDHNIWPEMGITGTPIIDAASGSLFVSVLTREVKDDGVHYIQRLHSIRLGDGSDRVPPALMGDTVRDQTVRGGYRYYGGASVAGRGDGSVDGRVTFNAMRENQRPALTIVRGVVYVAFASHNDIGPYHGWILGYQVKDLAPAAVFNATPNGGQAGIWMGGAPPSSDADGNLYVSTGNGSFEEEMDAQGFPIRGSYGNAFLRLTRENAGTPEQPHLNGWGLKVADYFVPTNYAQLNHDDNDIGGGGVVVMPDAAGSAEHRHLLVGGGKDRRLLIVDRDNMGRFHADGDRVVQSLPDTVKRIFSAPTFLDGRLLTAMDGDSLLAMPMKDAQVGAPELRSRNHFSFPGANFTVTSNGGKDRLLWLLDVKP